MQCITGWWFPFGEQIHFCHDLLYVTLDHVHLCQERGRPHGRSCPWSGSLGSPGWPPALRLSYMCNWWNSLKRVSQKIVPFWIFRFQTWIFRKVLFQEHPLCASDISNEANKIQWNPQLSKHQHVQPGNQDLTPAKVGPAPAAVIVVVPKRCELDVVASVSLKSILLLRGQIQRQGKRQRQRQIQRQGQGQRQIQRQIQRHIESNPPSRRPSSSSLKSSPSSSGLCPCTLRDLVRQCIGLFFLRIFYLLLFSWVYLDDNVLAN